MHLRRTKVVAIPVRELVRDEIVEHGLDGLEVRHVARGTDDGGLPNGVKTLDGFEPGEGAV